MSSVPSTLVTASQSVVDQCGLYSVDVVPMMKANAASHNIAAALISAVSGSSIRFTIHTRVVDPTRLKAAREQQQQQRALTLQFQRQQSAIAAKKKEEDERLEEGTTAAADEGGASFSLSSTTRSARGGKHAKDVSQRPTAGGSMMMIASGNVFDQVDEFGNEVHGAPNLEGGTPRSPRDNLSNVAAGDNSPAPKATTISNNNNNDPVANSENTKQQSVTIVKEHDFYDQDEIMIVQNSLTTYTVVRSLEHFVWFQRQLSEKEPFLLFGELPTSLAAAYADPLKTANQITAMIMFFVRSKATASDPFLWSLLTSPDDDFQAQYNSLAGYRDDGDGDGGSGGGVAPDLIAATDFIASTQENISGLQAGTSSIAPMRWNFSIGNSWSVGSPFAGRALGDDDGGDESDGNGENDTESSREVRYIRRLERLLTIVDQDEYSIDVIKRTRERVARAGLHPQKSALQRRYEREQRLNARREKKTAQLIRHINEKLTLPEDNIRPEKISNGMIESGMIDRAFFSCDKLNVTAESSLHFQKELTRHDKVFYAWGDALDAAYRLKVAMEDLADAQEALVPALRDLCETNYWPWTKEKVFEDELKPKLSPRVHTSHRLTHYAHRIANIHNEVSRIEKNFVSDGLISSITLGAMLYSGHRWSCAIAHQRVHRGNKIDAAVRHAVLGLDQHVSTALIAGPGVIVHNNYTVNEMKKTLLPVPPIFVQAVRTSLTPTAAATGRSLLGLQRDLKVIFEYGRGVSEAVMLDNIDDDTTDIQDSLDTIINTFEAHFREVRHDALYANVAQYLKELAVFLKFSWMSAELAIRDTHKNINEDLFTDLGREDLTFIMQRKTDPNAKYMVPPNFKVKEYESANTMIQQFRHALEKSRNALALHGGGDLTIANSGGNNNAALADSAMASSSAMIRVHVAKQQGSANHHSSSAAATNGGGAGNKKPFMAPTLANPFDMEVPPPPPPRSANNRNSINRGEECLGEEMTETSEEAWKQREFLQQMQELQQRQKQQQLLIEASRVAGVSPASPISTLTEKKLPSSAAAAIPSSVTTSNSPQPPALPSTNTASRPIPIKEGNSNSGVQKQNPSIFLSSVDDSMNLNSASSVPIGSVGSANAGKKRRFGRQAIDRDDPFA